jgi:outer membrane protein, heavy metal efflux system
VRFIILALLCFMSGTALAQSSPPPLTVEDAVALAVKHNPRLSAAVREVIAARSGVRSARALVNPGFVVAPSVPNSNGAPDAVLFTQPLELNGTRSARTGVADAQLRTTQARAIVEVRGLVFDVKSAYYELVRARELLSLAQDLLKTSEEFDRITRRQVELGRRPGIDLAQTGIEVTRAQQQVALAESRVNTAAIALNTLLNRQPEEPVGALSPLPAATAIEAKETVLRQALEARAEITIEESLRESFRQEARLARAEGRPDLAPQFRANEITRSFSPQDYGFSLAVTLPLFDWGSRRNRVRQAEESAQAQTDRITAARNQVRQEVEQALARLRAADTLLKTYQQGVLERAKRLLDASRTGLQEGQTSIIGLLEAQRTYRNVLTEYANAQADYALIRTELERVQGAVPASLLPVVGLEPRRKR